MKSVHNDAAARVEVRRAHWRGGRTSRAEAAAADRAFWQQVSGGDRLNAVLALAMEWYEATTAEPATGLRGSAVGIRRR